MSFMYSGSVSLPFLLRALKNICCEGYIQFSLASARGIEDFSLFVSSFTLLFVSCSFSAYGMLVAGLIGHPEELSFVRIGQLSLISPCTFWTSFMMRTYSLPLPTGPFGVGCKDFFIPKSAISPVELKEHEGTTLLFRSYFPIDKSAAIKEKFVNWVPSEEYYGGFACI